MKNIVKIMAVLCLFSGMISCNDWLDVKPEEQATQNELLKTPDGYRALLLGVYQLMSSPYMYGKEMTYGFVDCISQQYKLDNGNYYSSNKAYYDASKFDYGSNKVVAIIEGIWKNAYNAIANANNLIHEVEKTDPEIFTYNAMEKNLILGEALACRALIHFDLLRIFAPPVVNDDGRNYIPYVKNYPEITAPSSSVQNVLEYVIDDLERGRKLVMEWDTSIVGIGTVITGNARFRDQFSFGTEIYSKPQDWEAFLKGRGYRMNYYSITALLARVYQYAGNHEKAFEYAKEIIDFEVKDNSGMQKAFNKDDFSGIMSVNWETKKDLKVVSNLIFGLYCKEGYDRLGHWSHFAKAFKSAHLTLFVINKDEQKIWYNREGNDEVATDYRSVYWTFMCDGIYSLSGKYYPADDVGVREVNMSILPVIRATEMHYIMAETYARDGNYTEAARILNELRKRRGLFNTSITLSDWTEFQEELIRDARREWISEGQLFFLYKRLNAPVDFGKNVVRPLISSEYLVPVPDDQIF